MQYEPSFLYQFLKGMSGIPDEFKETLSLIGKLDAELQEKKMELKIASDCHIQELRRHYANKNSTKQLSDISETSPSASCISPKETYNIADAEAKMCRLHDTCLCIASQKIKLINKLMNTNKEHLSTVDNMLSSFEKQIREDRIEVTAAPVRYTGDYTRTHNSEPRRRTSRRNSNSYMHELAPFRYTPVSWEKHEDKEIGKSITKSIGQANMKNLYRIVSNEKN